MVVEVWTKMNILLITDKLITGGAETYFCKLENQLQHPNSNFYYSAASGEMQKSIKHKDQFSELSRTKHAQNIKKLREIIIEKQIDMIHANSLRMVLYSILLKKLTKTKVKIVYTKHNVTILEKKIPVVFRFLLNRYVERIITVCDFEKMSLLKIGVKLDKITTVYNGVDLKQFIFQKKEKREGFKIGILGRLSAEKNHALFVEIANKLRDVSSLMFYIAGDGPERQAIQNRIQSYNLAHKIKMVGAVSQPEDFLRDMDLILLTSLREVFPMVILEAMAVGTPIISINIGGIGEAIIDKQTGYLIAEHSVEDIIEKILQIQSEEDMRHQMIENARRKVESEFSLEQMVDQTIKVYWSAPNEPSGLPIEAKDRDVFDESIQ